jgi:hypothetical protein
LDKNIQLSYSGDGDDAWSASGSGVVGKVDSQGTGGCSTTNYNSTLTITNKRDIAAKLSFTYTVSLGGGTVAIDGALCLD